LYELDEKTSEDFSQRPPVELLQKQHNNSLTKMEIHPKTENELKEEIQILKEKSKIANDLVTHHVSLHTLITRENKILGLKLENERNANSRLRERISRLSEDIPNLERQLRSVKKDFHDQGLNEELLRKMVLVEEGTEKMKELQEENRVLAGNILELKEQKKSDEDTILQLTNERDDLLKKTPKIRKRYFENPGRHKSRTSFFARKRRRKK